MTNASKHIPKAVNDTNNFEIVFPYGSSFTVSRPSRPLMTSGMHSHPPNTPICATWEAETTGTYEGQRGRFVVLGSTDIFADDWIECEENIKLCDMLFGWLLNLIDLDLASFKTSTAVVESPSYVSSVDLLSHTLKPCLQDTERIPTNITELFQLKPFHISLGSTSLILNLYSELHLPHEPLGLISPQFDCPLPRLLGATFPPSMKDPCAPALDLFDLDELMAPPDVCLAQLTNKCTGGADDLEYYVHEAGIKLQVEDIDKGAKSILFEIFKTISHYKRAIISH